MLKTIMDLLAEVIGWAIELIKSLWLTDKFLTIYIALAIIIGNAYETKLNLYWLCIFGLLGIFGWHSHRNKQQPLHILDDYIDLFNHLSDRTTKNRTNNNTTPTGYIVPPRLGTTPQPTPVRPIQMPVMKTALPANRIRQKQKVNIVGKPTNFKSNENNTKEDIINLENILKENILSQAQAVESVIKGIRRRLAGTEANKNAPLTFLLTGPTGTGKTQLVKLVAKGLNREFDRYDMGNFKNEGTLWQLLGSPQGYQGSEGKLTQFVKKNPNGIVLFDEIEKGHNQMYDFMLPMIDEGIVKDNKTNEVINFQNTMVFFTTNLITEVPEEARENVEIIRDKLLETGFLRQELVARVRNIVPFYAFSEEDIITIVEQQITNYLDDICNLKQCNAVYKIHYSVIEFITNSVDKKYGARNVSQQIEKYISNELTDVLLSRETSISSVKLIILNLVENKVKITLSEEEETEEVS